jgi:hypothetical protein
MSKGGYVGGHTHIHLSEDGTVWPVGSHLDSNGEVLKATTFKGGSKRWAEDPLDEPSPEQKSSLLKENEFTVLAEYANAYRKQTPARILRSLSPLLVANVERCGGVVEWINADPHRLARFWKMVSDQGKPKRTSLVMPRSKKRQKSPKGQIR